MGENIRRLKMNSRAIIMMSAWQPVFIAAFYTVIVMILSSVILYASGYMDYFTEYIAAFQTGNMYPDIALPVVETTDYLIIAAAWLLQGIVTAGFSIAMLMLSRGKLAKARDLFNGFNMPLKVVVISVAKTVIITLGYMLFIVPGLVAAYMFRYSVEALYDDPTIGPFKAMRRSAELTKGHKMELFMLEISFIPWQLASALVATVLRFSVLDAWITPYMQLAFSVNYNWLSGWQPGENEDTSDNYVIWAKVNKDAASAPDMQGAVYPVQPDEPVQPSDVVTENVAAQQAEETPVEAAATAAAPSYEKPAPDIEYWKTRAIQLQKEMQEKNK